MSCLSIGLCVSFQNPNHHKIDSWPDLEGPLTKNGPIDFAESLAIYMKNPIRLDRRREKGG